MGVPRRKGPQCGPGWGLRLRRSLTPLPAW